MRLLDMDKPLQLIFASNNQHKLKEIYAICPSWLEVQSMNNLGFMNDIPEPFDTLEENSRTKAETIYNYFKKDCFAEDTGLEVQSLNNEPGVLSARYAGNHKNPEDNIDFLLKNLKGIANRKARFRTVLTLFYHDKVYQFEGIVNGKILYQMAGSSGFGYDPVFQPDGYEMSFAQMAEDEKNKISHRRMAFGKLVRFLQGQ
jgi:XTP/dITP diphosphohydrolase